MIIIGYQGIGKSTLAGKNNCIDLESGNFWVYSEEEKRNLRDKDWYITYCNIANHLSEQGYTVFTSSHEVVRENLKKSKERVYVIYPAAELKDKWISKLRKRYEETGLEKDYKALANAEDRYEENIAELTNCGLPTWEITDMDYSLENIVIQLNALR